MALITVTLDNRKVHQFDAPDAFARTLMAGLNDPDWYLEV